MAARRELLRVHVALMVAVAIWAAVEVVTLADAYNMGDTLRSNLNPDMHEGDFLYKDGFKFSLEDDCNLVLYHGTNPIWQSDTTDAGSYCKLSMQVDGNLVLYDGDNTALWATGTHGLCEAAHCDYGLFMQSDGNAVVYIYDFLVLEALWSTQTVGL